MSRPDPLPFQATRVLKGVREVLLAWGMKGTWLEHFALDHGPEGAYLGANGMAARVGLSPETVESYRRELVSLGLLVKGDAPRGATAPWYPVIPPECIPTESRPRPDQLGVYVRLLEAHLAKRRAGARQSGKTEARPVPPVTHTRIPQPTAPESASCATLPANPGPPLPTPTRSATGGLLPGGMEAVGVEVGENPPTSHPPSEVGGRARQKSDNGKPESESTVRVTGSLDAATLKALRRWEYKRRQHGDSHQADP